MASAGTNWLMGTKSESLHIPNGSIVTCIVEKNVLLLTVLLCAFQYATATLKTSGAPTMPYKTPDEESCFLMHIRIATNL